MQGYKKWEKKNNLVKTWRNLLYQNQLVQLILDRIKNCVIDNSGSSRDAVEKPAYVRQSRNNRQQDSG